jgi:pilus assembly protein Flp/PilA
MTKLINIVKSFAADDSGATILEYSLLIGLIMAAAVSLIMGGGAWVAAQWQTLVNALGGAPVAW